MPAKTSSQVEEHIAVKCLPQQSIHPYTVKDKKETTKQSIFFHNSDSTLPCFVLNLTNPRDLDLLCIVLW